MRLAASGFPGIHALRLSENSRKLRTKVLRAVKTGHRSPICTVEYQQNVRLRPHSATFQTVSLGSSVNINRLYLLVVSDPHLHYHSHKQVCPYEEGRVPI